MYFVITLYVYVYIINRMILLLHSLTAVFIPMAVLAIYNKQVPCEF